MQQRVTLLILAVVAGATPPALAADITEYMGRFAVMNPALALKGVTRPDACSEGDTIRFWRVLAGLNDEWEYGRKLRGKAALGFQGDDAHPYGAPAANAYSASQGDVDQYKVTAGLDLNRGTYPGEFKFEAGVDVRVKGGAFEQNVRDLSLAYDYWMYPWLEAFVFGRQFSDNFMEIDQRYEVGVGAFVGRYFGRRWAPAKDLPLLATDLPQYECLKKDWKGDAKKKKWGGDLVKEWETLLERAQEHIRINKTLSGEDPAWLRCYGAVLDDNSRAVKELSALFEDIEGQWVEAHHAQTQRNARFRLGVAFSVFGELEHATLKYTPIDTQGAGTAPATTQPTPGVSVPATQRYRWVARPTFEFRPTHRWEFKAEWYFKLPLNNSRTIVPGEAAARYDYRSDLDMKGTFTVGEKEIGQPGNVAVTVRYRRVFDNVPPFYPPAGAASAAPLVIAPDTHTMVTMDLGIRW